MNDSTDDSDLVLDCETDVSSGGTSDSDFTDGMDDVLLHGYVDIWQNFNTEKIYTKIYRRRTSSNTFRTTKT